MMRKGVSLITVLMFMLVATIAATATFKWLSSEGASSADRMLVNEARAAAVAGVEATRAWMTYHGNETGAVLKQFYDKKKANKKDEAVPIRLDGVLAPLAKDDQTYSVSVVDVQASPTMATYKVKIISTGRARSGQAEYTEVAYLAVSGLYKVPLPHPAPEAPYHYAYFGGSTSYSGAHQSTAMIINGDWGYGVYNKGSNPGHVENDFIVTGNAALSGSDISVGGTTCIGGNLNADNGFWGTDLYVDGNAVAPTWNTGGNKFVGQISGNAYFNGDLALGNQADPGFTVVGNMTLNGKMTPNLGGYDNVINGDLCLGDDATIEFSSDGSQGRQFLVGGNVYMPKSFGHVNNKGLNGARGTSAYERRIFGNKTESKLYIKDAFKCNNYYCDIGWPTNDLMPYNGGCQYGYSKKSCPTNGTLAVQQHINGGNQVSYSTFTTKGQVMDVPGTPPITCAKSVKAYCDSIWRPSNGKGCDGSPYIVDDILTTAYESFKLYVDKLANSGEADCRNIDRFSNANTTKMNTCFKNISNDPEKAKQYLYNGFAVFSLVSDENASSNTDADNAPKLDGNFVFIYENKLMGNNPHFPRTEKNARAMVYLRQGANTGASVSEGTHINCQDNTRGTHNYFIFTKGDIPGLLGNCIWEGSFYATAASCAKIPDINGQVSLEYNQAVVDDIFAAGLLCANNGTHCGKQEGDDEDDDDDGDDEDDEDGDEEYDDMYVATGDHLMVTVESEYKSKEELPNEVADVEPSVMVYPRVIYLNQDARGKLSDYYSVIQLNGLGTSGSSSLKAVDAAVAPPVSGKLLPNAGAALNQGIYRYIYTYTESSAKYTSDFYVVVMGDESETPLVHFDGTAIKAFNMGSTDSGTVSVVIEPSKGVGELSVRIAVSEILPGWHVTGVDGSNVSWQTATDGTKYITYKGPLNAAGTKVNLFKIKVDSDASPGAVRFMMQNPANCLLGGGTMVKTFNIKGAATISRASLRDYCLQYPTECEGEGAKYREMQDLDDCDNATGEWVKISCVGSTTLAPNDRWKCDAGVGNSNVAKLVSGEYDRNKCTLVIPTENNYVDNPQDDKSHPGGYVLYGELKRKSFKLKVDTEGAHASSGVSVKVGEKFEGPFSPITAESCEGGVCTYVVYADQYFRLYPDEKGDDAFSVWHCNSCTLSEEKNKSSYEYKRVMDKDFYITAVFNKKDDHCFYTEFENTDIWCSSDKIDCINYCDRLGASCSVLDGHNGYKNPNWVAVNSRGGGDKKPSITSVLGTSYLKYSGSPLILLSTVDGGPEGDYTIRLSTDVINKTLSSKLKTGLINSGVILRSNDKGTEYISLNFYGKSLLALGSLVAGTTYARACYVKDVVEKKNDDNCVAVSLKEKNSGILDMAWMSSTQLGFTVTLDGDMIHISGSYSYSSKLYQVEADIDLKDVVKQEGYTLNDEDHGRIGLKLADEEFHVYDVTWHSKKYSDECFADPRVFCSFAEKYMGGNVPKDQNVSPAISYSSWFSSKGAECMSKTTYFYNGCDMPSYLSLGTFINNLTFCPDVCSDGLVENFVGNDGTRVSGGEYNFRCEGAHGFKHATRDGYVRRASVEVNCNMVNGQKFTASCGEFYVGEQHNCQQDEEIYKSNGFPLSNGPMGIVVSQWGKTFNLRDADLVIDLTKDPYASVSAYLVDENGNKSDDFSLTQGGENVVPYTKFSDKFGFNPEKVSQVVLKGFGMFSVNAVYSHCAHSLKVYCGKNDAMFDGGIWRVKANIQPIEAAKKCLVKAKSGGVSESWFGDCNDAGEFYIEDPGFLDRVNDATTQTQVDFEVSVFDNPDALETSEPVSTCVASSQTYEPITLECDLGSDKRSVLQGRGVPALTFTASNCPSAGCDFEANLSNGTSYTGDAKASGTKTWTAPVNTEVALPAGDYSYQVKLYSDAKKTKKIKECTTPSFTVVEARAASASNCTVLDGRFYASVQGSNYEQVSATLVYTDMIGNPFSSKTVEIDANESVDFDLRGLADGSYTLTLMLNGKMQDGCSQSYTKGSSASAIKLECPSDIVGQSKNSSIYVRPQVTGCEARDCSYSVTPGTAGTSNTGYGGGAFSFYDVDGTGTKAYTLKVSKSGATDQTCGFNVSFTTEAAGGKCTVSAETIDVGGKVTFGITDMTPANEYVNLEILQNGSRVDGSNSYLSSNAYSRQFTFNSEATVNLSAKINNTVICTKTVEVKKPSSDGVVVFTITAGNNIPQEQKSMASGTCMTVNGVWTNTGWYPPLVIRCNANGNMTVTHNGRSLSGANYLEFDLNYKPPYTETTQTFVSNICVTSDASDLRCGLGNK